MDFDKDYFAAREEGVKWLRRDIARRDYQKGLSVLEKMNYKPMLLRRLRLHKESALLRQVLTNTIREAVNAYRNPSSSRNKDEIPAELEELTSGTTSEGKVEEEDDDTDKFKAYPAIYQEVLRRYRKAYNRRGKMHRQLREVGENNDSASMARRKDLAKSITDESDYMDDLYPLIEAFKQSGKVPTEAQLKEIEARHEKAASATGTEGLPSIEQSSLRIKDEDYASMSREELRARRHTVRSQVVKKKNLLLYQEPRKLEKENPMPPSPMRTKIETQVRLLEERLYQIDKQLAKLG